MKRKNYARKAIAVCLMFVFTWLAVASWVFTYEIAEWWHCAKWIPEYMAVLFGFIGLISSCLAYGKEEGCLTK